MQTTHRTLLIVSIFVGTTGIFSACLNSNSNISQSQLNSGDTMQYESQNGSISDQSQTPSQDQQQVPTTQQGAMKQLSDFEQIEATHATITTTKGAIKVELYREKTPVTTANFLQLAKDGYYDGIIFHRVIPGFMAQVGDPLTKDPSQQALWGTGGPGYVIPDEFDPDLKHDAPGILSMANRGPNTGGSQIFITFAPQPHLDGKHAVFGKVIEGLDVLESIEQGDSIVSISYQ